MPLVEEIHIDDMTAGITIKALNPPEMAGKVNNFKTYQHSQQP